MESLLPEPPDFATWFFASKHPENFPELRTLLENLQEPLEPHRNMMAAYEALTFAFGQKPPRNTLPLCGIWNEHAKKFRKEAKRRFLADKCAREAVSPKLRYYILNRDNFHCCYCGRGVEDDVALEVDHIIPVSKGGMTIVENLCTACFKCNRGKGDSLP